MYDGPLKVPNKRAKKDPLAPKRAMSAFLHFSQSMRPRLRDTYPEAKNMDMSKMLGQVRLFPLFFFFECFYVLTDFSDFFFRIF